MLSSDFSVCSISSDVLTHLHSARTRLQRALVGEGGVLWNSTKNMSCNHPLKTWVCWTGQVGMRRGEEVGCELLMQVKIWLKLVLICQEDGSEGRGSSPASFSHWSRPPAPQRLQRPRSHSSLNSKLSAQFVMSQVKWKEYADVSDYWPQVLRVCVCVCVCWNI